MKTEKAYGAMVRLDEDTYFSLRKIALDQRTNFSQLARQVLEGYLKRQKAGAAKDNASEAHA
jgi:predicted transcriptional regulator